jgi:hypothetical protein
MLACLAASFVTCLLSPTTWIVDVNLGPGAHFPDIQLAINAAASGDTILVRPGAYGAASIAGKTLAIRGAGIGATSVASLYVAGTAGETVFTGFRIDGPMFTGNPVFVASAHVVLVQCRIEASHAINSTAAVAVGPGGVLVATDTVVLAAPAAIGVVPAPFGVQVLAGGTFLATSCTIEGGRAVATGTLAGAGGAAISTAGDVVLHRTSCRGGDCPLPTATAANRAGDAFVVQAGGTARVAGDAATTLQGGVARNGAGLAVVANCGRIVSGIAGTQLTVHGAVQLLPAVTGAPLASGSALVAAAALPWLSVQGPQFASGEQDAAQPAVLQYDGLLANAPHFLAIGFASTRTPMPPLLGDLLVDLNVAGLMFGTLDGAGHFAVPFVPVALLGGVLGVPLFAQCGTLDVAAGNVRTSNLDVRVYSL